MPKCDKCGEFSSHTKTKYNPDFSIAEASCKLCRPEDFDDAFRDPSDNKIYHHHEAFPHMYKRNDEGVYIAKDEVSQNTLDIISQDPEAPLREAAIAKKRATRRTTPMTRGEIEAAQNYATPFVKEWKEQLKREFMQREEYIDEVVGRVVERNKAAIEESERV